MISKYAKKVKLRENVYAVFNSLLLEPVFLSKSKTIDLFNNKLSSFNYEEKKTLKSLGIIVSSSNIDEQILKEIHNSYNKMMNRKISIMYLIPTNSCNLQCRYCFIGQLNEKPQFLTFDTAKNAVDKFNEHLIKTKQHGTIFFYGAEPLLNFALIKQIVEYVHNSKFDIEFSMVSNGLLISEEIAEFIKNYNIAIGISLDGIKKINDKNRIFKESKLGSYEYVIKKMKILKTHNVNFGLSITISKELLKEKETIFEWLKDLDVKNISYNLMHFTEYDPEWEKYYQEATDFIYNSNNILYELGFNEDRANRKIQSFYERKFKFSDCGAVGGNQITICPNGDIEICHGYWNRKDNKIGNINDINCLEELFELEAYKEWQQDITINNKECLGCEAIYLCGRGCPKQSKELFGNERGIDKAFCIYSKNFLKYLLEEVYISNMDSRVYEKTK